MYPIHNCAFFRSVPNIEYQHASNLTKATLTKVQACPRMEVRQLDGYSVPSYIARPRL